ncbi:S-layer homology domain-containing protein [Sedimentibacter sp.]|uniref:S-layer homology domain-containing protein n=1 Tax=Sedimentibacter sp. TaxID=1960295 RepID=UPI0028A2BE9A|nr:S-layer homology domain-containing protein [Sedimentibacter sp.]
MKKTLFIMILIIILSAMNTAYAKSFPDVTKDSILQEAVGMLSGYKIMEGYPDGSFKPDKNVTRAEMAKIVTVAAGWFEYSKNMTSVYEDMTGHWAESYVELANVLNIVKGISPNLYGPDNLIKFEEAYTMVIRLLGYTDEALGGNWPQNYYQKALELNLFRNIDTNKEFASRRDVSVMIYNALSMNLVDIKENKITQTNKPLLTKLGKKENKEINIGDLKTESFDLTDYLFNKWDVYYDSKGNVVYLTNPKYNEFSGRVTSLLSNRVIFVTDDYGNVRAWQLPNVPIVVNSERGNFNDLENSRIKIVYENDSFNGDVIGIIAYKETDVIVVDRDDLYKEGSKTFAGKSLPTKSNYEMNHNKLHISGDAHTLKDIQENDVVYFYESKGSSKVDALKLVVLRKQTDGTVTNVQTEGSSTFYTVNGISYKTGDSFISTEKISVNDKVKLILDKNNNIIKINVLSYGKNPTTLGLVISATSSKNSSASARIFDQNGNLRTYSLADNSSVVNIVESGSDLLKQTTLKKNDFIKFDPVSGGSVKIINFVPSTHYIAYNYNEHDRTLSNGYKISSDTFIVYESGGRYQLLQPSQLDTYLEGKAVISNGHMDALYLSKGIKSASDVEIPAETPQNYSGKIYSMIKGITKVNDTTSHIQFYENSNVFSVSNTSAAGKTAPYLANSYVKADIVNGVITTIERVTPETDRVKITQVYSTQMQIDSITYMEYADSITVYICTVDKAGNVIGFKSGSKSDLKSGSTVQLYDLYGGFDGIVDVAIIYN